MQPSRPVPAARRPLTVADARPLFTPRSGYLNTATVGIPPAPALDAIAAAVEDWRSGRVDAPGYDADIARSRKAFARLVGTSVERVAIVPQVSIATGVVASALQSGDEVLVAREDFTSVLFPFLDAQQRGVVVRAVPLDDLLDEIRPGTRLVAVSAVQSADGRVLDLDGLAAAVEGTDTLSYVDATQAAGWLPIGADRFSVTACGAYKWLACPRGAGFMTIRPDVAELLTPVAAGWYAGDDPWASIYGPPLRLADDARRFDVSPAWLSWVAAAPTLELLAGIGHAAIGAHDVALANRFLAGVGLPPSDSAIVSIDRCGAAEALQEAGVAFAGRAGRVRLAFHLYTTHADVDLAAAAVASASAG